MPQEKQSCRENEWINACPAGLLALDDKGVIRWLNPALEKMLELSGDQLLDQNRDTLSLPAYRVLFDEDEIIGISTPRLGQRWFQREVSRVPSGSGDEYTLHSYRDISTQIQLEAENDRLREQVQELTLTDNLTGLANRRALINALTAQVTRTRRYHNPLTLIVVQVELGDDKTHAIRELPEQATLVVSHYLRDRLRWADIIGRYDHSQFLLILPETDKQAAVALAQKIRSESSAIVLPKNSSTLPLRINFGVAEWEKGDDPRSLTERVIRDMELPNWRPGGVSKQA